MPQRENENNVQFIMRQVQNELVEKIASWIELYGSNDPVIVARAIRREFKDE